MKYSKYRKLLNCCFDKDTKIKLDNDEEVLIKDVKIGNILANKDKVTAVMELSIYGQEMYDVNGVIVSGNHRMYNENDELVQVRNHPNSIKIEEYRDSMIYCFNTSSKKIIINNMIFTDWDDLDEMDMVDIKQSCCDILPTNFNINYIHKYLDGGFEKNTKIELEYGYITNICDIAVNDILRFSERVVGTIKIDATDLQNIYEYHLEDKCIKGSANLHIIDDDLGCFRIHGKEGIPIHNEKYIYHLLTDTGFFTINGMRFGDYNTGLENYMDNDIMGLLSQLF